MARHPEWGNGEITPRTFVFWLVVASILAGISHISEQRAKDTENLCPGPLSVAPREKTSFLDGSTVINIYHHGISMGPDTVSFSAVNDGETIFAGPLYIDHNETIEAQGVDFRERGTEEQAMTGTVLTVSQGKDNCVTVTFP